jgi:hypothetical protein
MKRTLLPLCLAVALLPLYLMAQNPDDALHAPDGNTHEQFVNIFIAPLLSSPFIATVSASWTRQLADSTTITLANHRLVIRDSKGRIYQERRLLVPDDANQTPTITRIEISDPTTHTKDFCYPGSKTCRLDSYYVAVSEPIVPVGPMSDGKHYLSREDLGKGETEGLETIGTRETVTTSAGAFGNDHEIAFSKKFWYSPKLGINLAVKRLDPVHGPQTFNVGHPQLAEPDARIFTVPEGYKVVDERIAPSTGAK